MDINFEELANYPDIIALFRQVDGGMDKIEEVLKLIENKELYENLSNAEKIRFNLLMVYGINSLFWMYLRAEGIDPNNHEIKLENERLKQAMARAKQVHDRNTIMPRIDKDAAKRFVRSGLWQPRENTEEDTEEHQEEQEEQTWDCPS